MIKELLEKLKKKKEVNRMWKRGQVSFGARLRCLYTNTRSMGNKQEELEMCAHLQGHDIIGITETWWDVSYDWSVAMDGYRLFRKDRPGRQGEGVAIYVRDRLESMELCLGGGDQRVCGRGLKEEQLWGTLLWGSVTDLLIKRTLWMKHSIDR